MATTVSAQVCSICGKPLGGSGNCVVCLLSAGLEQEPISDEAQPDAFAFEGFEIMRREDGSLWELGRGAMGVTYRALDKSLHRSVALKVIDLGSVGSRAVQNRFLREARAAASLRHPNIAGVFHFGALADRCYYAMELVEGETLEARVRRDGPLDLNLVLEVGIQVTQALGAAAAQGLVHRDLKPGNIMLTTGEGTAIHAKVIDFGLAKATVDTLGEMDLTQGGFVGTPTFASPEQFDRGQIDPRSDIYSLGATLWFALTGVPPFSGQTVATIRSQQKHSPLPLAQLRARKVPAPVIALLRRTLALNPAQRPTSARELMEQLQTVRRKVTRRRAVASRSAWVLPLAAAVLALATVFVLRVAKTKSVATPGTVTEKSIAVLPFENLSPEKENAFFADALQDDLLTNLAKIRALKVISRTSASQYRGPAAARNLRAIARELGVENILEGSVRREGGRLLVNMQLIGANDDRHLWAEHYDRVLADSIGLQAEVATHVAAVLMGELAPAEKARLEVKPTNNPDAYVLYLRALQLEGMVNATAANMDAAEKLYEEAIARDRSFALAYARASVLNSHLTLLRHDETLKAKARQQAEQALRLAPSLGDGHLALGLCLYWGEKDYFAALKEFSVAANTAPNNAEILHLTAGIYRRQGRWRESLANYQRAMELDPRNRFIVSRLAAEYILVRDWSAATATYNRALEIAPDSAEDRMGLAYLEIFRNSNPASAGDILRKVSADPDGRVSEARWDLAMLARDFDAAAKILRDFPSDAFPNPEEMPKSFFEGRIARARGDLIAAHRLIGAAAPEIEEYTRDHPEPQNHANLALLYAYLGRIEDAVREANLAIEMEPESQNAFHGAGRAGTLAVVYALTGETDQAITLIQRLLSAPGCVGFPNFPQNITLADLRLRWEWDGLRSDPRFQKILAGPEPKTNYN